MSQIVIESDEIDWPRLRAQKQALVEAVGAAGDEELEGILGLIDLVQDRAVEEAGVDEALVFPPYDESVALLYGESG